MIGREREREGSRQDFQKKEKESIHMTPAKTTESGKEIITVGEAAFMLRCSDETVRHYAKTGKLPFFTTSFGWRLFKRSDVLALVEEKKKAPNDWQARAARYAANDVA